ncbi:GAF and ANTAR domain-containing protein [Cellulomonas sp. Y8]|uniref:GAF and ANTAR domain-containing protein n=1 Tax=Cellulomonas sp. Y8 TaxID=2591145 RepID=UPI003D763720
MTTSTSMAALTSGLAALADQQDAVSALSTAVAAAADALHADVGVVVAEDAASSPRGRLDLLAASSHAAAALETYQLQVGSGPCLDAVRGDRDVSVVGETMLRTRWPALGSALTRAGYRAAHAFPMRWRGRPFGALNLFLSRAHPLTADERATARAFADIAAVAIVHADDRPDLEALARAVRATAAHRAVVEQAKGAVRYLLGVDEGRAFALLMRRARATGQPITVVAREVADAVAAGSPPDWLAEG